MSDRDTLIRSLHDLGMAAWFGGTLMGAVGLNGAAAAAKDPSERLRLSSIGWAKWTPVQIAAIAVHSTGGAGLILSNRKRVVAQPGAGSLTAVKLVLTGVAMAASAYAGVLGSRIKKHQHEGAAGTTEPSAGASSELAAAQKQLKVIQWTLPALTGTLVVMGAVQGEQQRGIAGLLDLGPAELARAAVQSVRKAA